jgi:hypothetical protein
MQTLKSVLASALAVVALAAIAWTGTYLYWHIRIVRALRTWETQAPAELEAASDVLNEAGCRSLPYLVGALDPRKNTAFLTFVTTQVAFATGDPHKPLLGNIEAREHLTEWRIEKEDSPALRQRKCDLIREWWRENGGRHHQPWRIWSSQCAR